MRAIALSLAIALLCTAVRADTHTDVMHVFGGMASALSSGNPDQFMDAFDRNMPDYERIKDEVIQLVAQGQITTIAQPTKDEGDNKRRSVDLDWSLDIPSADAGQPPAHRRETVHCRLERLNRHWRIVALDPISFFAPQNFNQK